MSETVLDIKTGTIIKVLVVILLAGFLYLIRDVMVALFLAIMISSAINPFALWMERKKIPRLLSVVLVFIIFFGVLGILLSQVVPTISSELRQLTAFIPDIVSEVSIVLESAQASESQYSSFFGEIENSLNRFAGFLDTSSESIFDFLRSVFGGALTLFAAIVLSFYMAIMPKGFSSFVRSILPDRYEDYVIHLWERSERKVGKWFQGQLMLAVSVGILVFIGLSLLNVPYAMVLAILAMLLEVVPVAGPVISGIPALVLAFAQSPILALWVLILYAVVQQIESNILTPVIMGKTVGLSPVTVIISLLIGAQIAGIVGILIAVPVAVVVVEVLDDLAEEKEKRQKEAARRKPKLALYHDA